MILMKIIPINETCCTFDKIFNIPEQDMRCHRFSVTDTAQPIRRLPFRCWDDLDITIRDVMSRTVDILVLHAFLPPIIAELLVLK